MTRFYTAAQLRAFAWLPADGSWKVSTRPLARALASLNLCHRSLVLLSCDSLSGSREYCLTLAGIAERARLVKDGLIR
jgi:hypothetical protein